MSDTVVGLIDCDIANLTSVQNALRFLGADMKLVQTAADFEGISHLIIPGVGAFRAVMDKLSAQGLVEPIRAFAASGKPVAGLCLGMQLLATVGEEGGPREGLGLIPGRVTKLDPSFVPTVPHVGWNSVTWARKHPATSGVKSGVDFYFVHSFIFEAENQADVLGSTEYGASFPSVVAKDNVIGFQFHPEKSQTNGLRLIRKFVEWDGVC